MTFDREAVKTKLAEVRAWLAKNVVAPDAPKTVTISRIRFDWEKRSGTFKLSLDNVVFQEDFDLRIEITGRPTFYVPMFHSPLGVPASYAAIELDQKTEAAIRRALIQVFPRLRAYGLHKDLDLIIDAMSPFEERIIDEAGFKEKCADLPKAVVTVAVV